MGHYIKFNLGVPWCSQATPRRHQTTPRHYLVTPRRDQTKARIKWAKYLIYSRELRAGAPSGGARARPLRGHARGPPWGGGARAPAQRARGDLGAEPLGEGPKAVLRLKPTLRVG